MTSSHERSNRSPQLSPASARHTPGRVWGWPVALGLLSATGLVSALVSDGWGDTWSWLALGVPLLVVARCVLRR